MDDDAALRETIAMAREAGALAQRMRADPQDLQTRVKGPMDLVTAADFAAEDLLRARIGALEPGAAILGEEGGFRGSGPGIWIVDPIDGTVNFCRGSPNWAVSVARFEDGALRHGVIHAPDLGLTAWARRGRGGYLNGRPAILKAPVAQGPLVALGISTRGDLPAYLGRIERLRAAGVEYRRSGAATICFLGVLAGWFDAFHEPELNIWDAAAGLLIVEEAGGVVHHDPFADFLTRPSEVVARNPAYPELAALLG